MDRIWYNERENDKGGRSMAYRILIVDDEAALQNMVKEILTQAGY